MSRRGAWTTEALVAGVRAGEPRALARAISLVEDADPAAYELVRARLSATPGSAYAVGLTGPPGVGKSTPRLGAHRPRPRRRADGRDDLGRPVEPVHAGRAARRPDPARRSTSSTRASSSARWGRAATRGGLAEATLQALLVLDAAGKDVVFLETVGTGQSEVGVISIADTVVLVLMPGSGDSIQALKAGIMEIPDVIVVNKLDHPLAGDDAQRGAAGAAARPRRATGSRRSSSPRRSAARASTLLWEKIEEHRAHLESAGLLEERRRRNLAAEVFAVASARARRHLEAAVVGRSGAAAAPRRGRAPRARPADRRA